MKLAVESFSHNLTYKKSPSFGIQHSYLSDGYFHLLHTVYGSFLEFNCKLLCVSWKLPTKFTTITQEKSRSFQAKKKTPFSEGSDEIHSFHIYFHHFQTESRGAPQLAQPHDEPAQINHIANFREGTRFKQRLYEDKQLKA